MPRGGGRIALGGVVLSSSFANLPRRRYWTVVGCYVLALLLTQSVMGLGIDKFKELWGTRTLEIVAYVVVGAGASLIVWAVWWLWVSCEVGERAWIGVALVAYGVGTLSARSPQERLHYLGYGLLAVLLFFGFARAPRGAPGGAHSRLPLVAAVATLLVGSLIGLVDELLQILWPRRYFDWVDVAMNVVAVGLGLIVAVPVWNALRRRAGVAP